MTKLTYKYKALKPFTKKEMDLIVSRADYDNDQDWIEFTGQSEKNAKDLLNRANSILLLRDDYIGSDSFYRDIALVNEFLKPKYKALHDEQLKFLARYISQNNVFNMLYNSDYSEIIASVKSVSSSGMRRKITFKLVSKKGEIYNLNYFIGKLCDYKATKNYNEIIVNGCGMDMIFSVIYNLAYLMPKGSKGYTRLKKGHYIAI